MFLKYLLLLFALFSPAGLIAQNPLLFQPDFSGQAVFMPKGTNITPLCADPSSPMCFSQWINQAIPLASHFPDLSIPQYGYFMPSFIPRGYAKNPENNKEWAEVPISTDETTTQKIFQKRSDPSQVRVVTTDEEGKVTVQEGQVAFVNIDDIQENNTAQPAPSPTSSPPNKASPPPTDNPTLPSNTPAKRPNHHSGLPLSQTPVQKNNTAQPAPSPTSSQKNQASTPIIDNSQPPSNTPATRPKPHSDLPLPQTPAESAQRLEQPAPSPTSSPPNKASPPPTDNPTLPSNTPAKRPNHHSGLPLSQTPVQKNNTAQPAPSPTSSQKNQASTPIIDNSQPPSNTPATRPKPHSDLPLPQTPAESAQRLEQSGSSPLLELVDDLSVGEMEFNKKSGSSPLLELVDDLSAQRLEQSGSSPATPPQKQASTPKTDSPTLPSNTPATRPKPHSGLPLPQTPAQPAPKDRAIKIFASVFPKKPSCGANTRSRSTDTSFLFCSKYNHF